MAADPGSAALRLCGAAEPFRDVFETSLLQSPLELLEAQGILAVGKAQAEAAKLQYTVYETPGAKSYVTIKVAESLAQAHQNVKGYLPNDMHIITLGSNFMNAVARVVEGSEPATPVAPARK